MAAPTTRVFLEAVQGRRSVYALNAKLPIPDSRIHAIVDQIMLTVPSAFNSQPIRVVLLLHDEHKKFWESAKSATEKSSTDAAHVQRSFGRINGFEHAAGTVLFFNDEATVAQSRAQVAAYAGYFSEWAHHSQGMHQFALWTALDAEGVGANLQHYQFLGDEFLAEVRKTYGLPAEWELTAQLVFGGKEDANPPAAKEKKPLTETIKVFGEQ